MNRPPNFNQIHPNQATAICSRAQAELLINYDQHQVNVLGKAAVLLTQEWIPIEEHIGPFVLTVVFHHASSHPPASDEIQNLVNGLKFQVRGQPR